MKPVYIDWMDPVTGDIVLVGRYRSTREAAESIGVPEKVIRNSLYDGTTMRSGCQAHYGKPKAVSLTSYVTVEVASE